MACLIGIQTIALSCNEEIIKQEIKQDDLMRSRVILKACFFSFSPSSLLSMVGGGSFNVACKRKFRELKTADEEKALLEKSKIDTICPKVFLL